MESVVEQVVSLINKVLQTTNVREDSQVGNPHQWNSLKHIEIILAVEDHFKIRLSDENIVELTSIKTIAGCVDRHVRK